MRPDHHINRGRTSRTIAAGVPVALAGSIALVLSASPADAAETRSGERMMRALPASLDRAMLTLKVVASARPATYTVRQGDTVSAIASRFGLRTVDVLAINGLGWRSIIHPGDVLRLTGTTAAAPAAPTAPVVATPGTKSATYTVQRGDTVSAIAQRHGVSIQAMLSANGLGWSSIIYPGNALVIPGNTVLAATPAAAPAPAPAPPKPPAAAPAAGGSYTIKAGDTISSIASRHGVSIKAVLAANKLGWSSIIYPGQTIRIPAPSASAPAQAVASIPGLDAEQIANAKTIVRVGRELGVPDRGIAIALGTAMQESSLRNLNRGDRDSRGLFQQRPSTGWGTPAEVTDPVRSAKAFYGGASDPNGSRTRGLLDIAGWQGMSFTQAAQAVQISAYPDAYAQWEKSASAWLAALG